MNLIAVVGALALLVTMGCVSPSASDTVADTMMNKSSDILEKNDVMEKKLDTVMEKPSEAAMVKNEYVPFTQQAYEQAKADGKVIFLEFYATWCPTCQAQAPALTEGISRITSDNFAAFRVNYKDSDTDADESALAKKFNITYQHTHILTNASEETLLKSQEMWSAEDVVEKLGALV